MRDSAKVASSEFHLPVMPEEVLQALAPFPGGLFLDGTLGGGGHAALVLKALAPSGVLYGIEQDPDALATAQARLASLGAQVEIRRGNFADVLPQWDLPPLDGILFDLGVSSHQLDTAQRGFSFMREGPLDMRMDPTGGSSAAEMVNQLDERSLADAIFRYGEERHARAIARAIVKHREIAPFRTTTELVQLVERIVPRGKDGLHPATRTFQGLRIAVNQELAVLETVLPVAVSKLKPGGRLAVISFHSLEDRIVKHFFRSAERGCICPPRLPACACGRAPTLDVVTSKPLVASPQEVQGNPRARSAKLRVAIRR